MEKALVSPRSVLAALVAATLASCGPSSAELNAQLRCSSESEWFDIDGVTWIHAHGSGRALFSSEQHFQDACGVDVSEFSVGQYPVGTACHFRDASSWDGAEVRYRVEDHGHWYRVFVVQDVDSGVEVLACAGFM